MGKVYSILIRPIRSFNIENRAARIISQQKPVPAPQYPSTEKQKKLSEEVNPNFMKEHYRKDIQLDQRLKDVFVTSTDSQKIIEPTREPRLLPQNRITPEYTFDFFEPTMIPVGKCSLKQILEFIMQHKQDPVTYNSENIAAEYKIDKKIVDDILKYFKLYTMSTVSSEKLIDDSWQKMFDDAMEEKKRRELIKEKKKKGLVEEKEKDLLEKKE